MQLIGRISSKLNSRRNRIITVVVTVLIIAIIVVLLIVKTGEYKSRIVYRTHNVSTVSMSQSVTAGGKVTTGKARQVKLKEGKTVKATVVEENEAVLRGQPLVYYTDGSHTDAPTDCIIKGLNVPENREAAGKSNYVSYSSTRELCLKIVIPEDQISEIEKGEIAVIKINAFPKKEYHGRIIEKNDISTTLLSEDSDKSKDKDSDADKTNEEDNRAIAYDEGENGKEPEDSGEEQSEDDVFGEKSDAAYYSVTIAFENDKSVRPGMSANCIITISSRADVLAVPVEAVSFNKKGDPYVIMEDGEKAYVKIGESDPENVEIISGLKKGDKIKVETYEQ